MKKFGLMLLTLVLSVGTLVGCGSEPSGKSTTEAPAKTEGKSESKSGGVLKVAYPTQPSTLDPHSTTANATRDPARLIYETLVALDGNDQVKPLLAESYQVSEDGKTVNFKLRQGVKFHNGQEMKAEDVVASMTKWGKSGAAKAGIGDHEWVAKGDYEVELHVKQPSSVLMLVLAEIDQFPAIMPKSVIEKAGPTGVTEFIGTGPFKFEEWKHDQYMLFSKFNDYKPVNEPASGLVGKKEALVDKIYYYFVADDSTRITGLMSGEYDFAHMLPYDAVPQVKSMPGAVVDEWPYGTEMLVFNKQQGVFSNVKARQAVNNALDLEAIQKAAFTDKQFYEMDPGLFLPSQKGWYTDAGKEFYNVKDLEKAKQLLKESGYNGEQVVILTSRDYAHHYNAAVATQQQLQKIGMNVKLDVYDWATLLDRRNKPDMWDIFYTGFPIMATPHQYTYFNSKAKWPGWTNNPEFDQLLDKIKAEKSQDKAKELYVQLQQKMWEDLPVINIGKNKRVSAYSDKIKGYKEFRGPVFWNVSVNK